MRAGHAINRDNFFIKGLSECLPSYWSDPIREEYFEIVFFESESSVRLIPVFRSEVVPVAEQHGTLMAFKRGYLEQDDKEYELDTINLFHKGGEYSALPLDREVADRLMRMLVLMKEECANPEGTYIIVKALLKAFLANLIRALQGTFLDQDLNQKRVLEFTKLVNQHYIQERKAGFYAREMGIGEKRLNQVLLEKTNKTITQQIHLRLILEAQRMLISAELTAKEIAYALNFEDPAYFTRFFKRHTGQTPEEFRKEADSL